MALHHRIVEHATSSQSHIIVAAVLVSFLVWVTLQGRLTRYLNALGIGARPAPMSAAAGSIVGGAAGGGVGSPGSIFQNLPNPFPSLPIPTLPGTGSGMIWN